MKWVKKVLYKIKEKSMNKRKLKEKILNKEEIIEEQARNINYLIEQLDKVRNENIKLVRDNKNIKLQNKFLIERDNQLTNIQEMVENKVKYEEIKKYIKNIKKGKIDER